MKRGSGIGLGILLATACNPYKERAQDKLAEAPSAATENEPPRHGPVRPNPIIWFEPMDLSTGVGQTVPKIGIDNLGEPVPENLLASLERNAHLERLASGDVIGSRMEKDAGSPTGDPRGSVQFHPNTQLAAEWHILRLAALPEGLDEPTFPSHIKFSDGSIGVRFRNDSFPMLWGVKFCEKGDRELLILEMTERVMADPGAPDLVMVRQGDRLVSCSIANDLGSAEGTGALVLSCGKLEHEEDIDVTLADSAFVGLSGVPLQPPFSHAVAPTSLVPWGEGCRVSRTELVGQ